MTKTQGNSRKPHYGTFNSEVQSRQQTSSKDDKQHQLSNIHKSRAAALQNILSFAQQLGKQCDQMEQEELLNKDENKNKNSCCAVM